MTDNDFRYLEVLTLSCVIGRRQKPSILHVNRGARAPVVPPSTQNIPHATSTKALTQAPRLSPPRLTPIMAGKQPRPFHLGMCSDEWPVAHESDTYNSTQVQL
jgi:hypothetical protein